MAMIAMTTRSSIKVKAEAWLAVSKLFEAHPDFPRPTTPKQGNAFPLFMAAAYAHRKLTVNPPFVPCAKQKAAFVSGGACQSSARGSRKTREQKLLTEAHVQARRRVERDGSASRFSIGGLVSPRSVD
jgi:hypothetical protein